MIRSDESPLIALDPAYGTTLGTIASAGNLYSAPLHVDNSTSGDFAHASVAGGSYIGQVNTWIPKATTAMIYDDDGNLTADGRWNYTWDRAGRLASMTPTTEALAAGVTNRTISFAYDWMGRRIAKRILNNAVSPATITDMLYLHEGWNPVAIGTRTGTASSMVAISLKWTNLWGPDIGSFGKVSGSADFQAAGGVGGLLASSYYSSSTTTPDNHFVPSYDANGNILAWTSQTGALAQQKDYDPFGNVVMQRNILSGVPDFGFSTKLQDIETGLLYYGYRFYDPIIGRWPSRDLIEERGGVNLYGFVGNDGVNWVDILGLESCHVVVFFGHHLSEKEGQNVDQALKEYFENAGQCDKAAGLACNTGKMGAGNISNFPDQYGKNGEKPRSSRNGGFNVDTRDLDRSPGFNRSGHEGNVAQTMIGWARLAATAWQAALNEGNNMCQSCKDCEVVVEFRCVGNEKRQATLQRLRNDRVEATSHLSDKAEKKYFKDVFNGQTAQEAVPNCGQKKTIKCSSISP